jgi:hypothetical protein
MAPCRRFIVIAAETYAPQVHLIVALSQNLAKSLAFASVASRLTPAPPHPQHDELKEEKT